ncbi:hypothetical protein K1719_028318 [Acacia pycnantha]|nr:hypothetical protein K1719_028318 [Acacia pycnantha]
MEQRMSEVAAGVQGFQFDDKEKDRLQRPFRRTLVVKLMGRKPAYVFMQKKLRQLWERKGKIDIFDLENDFYQPEFNPRSEKIESLIAWVRLPELPAPFFDKKFLLNLGNVIGKAIRLDVHTAQRARGKFARMCVELDLTKPLIPSFCVEGRKLDVVYESLNSLCMNCGWYGHSAAVCESFHKSKAEADMDVEKQGGRNRLWQVRGRERKFTVLHEDVDQEIDAGSGGQMEANLGTEKGAGHTAKGKSQGYQNKNGKQNGSKKGGIASAALPKVSMERNTQGNSGAKVVKSGKSVVTKGNGVLHSKGLDESQLNVNYPVAPEIMKTYNGKEVNASEKENLHPGEILMRMETRSNDVIMVGGGEFIPECGGVGLGEVFTTPVLADV